MESFMALLFFIGYAFFLNGGIDAVDQLLKNKFTTSQVSLISLACLAAGYSITKRVVY